jgi:hypothetical protein
MTPNNRSDHLNTRPHISFKETFSTGKDFIFPNVLNYYLLFNVKMLKIIKYHQYIVIYYLNYRTVPTND